LKLYDHCYKLNACMFIAESIYRGKIISHMVKRKEAKELLEFSIFLGEQISQTANGLKRSIETNQEWADKLESVLEVKIEQLLENFAKEKDYQIYVIEMPYVAKSVEAGLGKDFIKLRLVGDGKKKIACLYDVIDGTWNEKAGLRFTVSTLIAFTKSFTTAPKRFKIGDFVMGVVAPHHGEGLYYTIKGSRPAFKNYLKGKVENLKLTEETNTNKLRCIIDIFTAHDKKYHDRALDLVSPAMRAWRDFGRYYGTGIELMALLGRSNTEPAYGGYLTVDQKSDNLVAPLLILNGAGAFISDWEGNSIENRFLEEKTNVIIASNKTLYDSLASLILKKPDK